MINYIRSEWYRIIHTTTIYVFTGIMTGLVLLINIVLFAFDRYDAGFPYGTVSFSLSSLSASMTILFFMGMVVVSLLFSGEKKNGVLKNTVAIGIPRVQIFLGKCIVSVGVSICSMIVILAAYIVSAVLLLEPGVEPDAVWILFRGIGYVFVMAVATEVLAIALFSLFEKEIVACIIWYLILVIVPQICNLVGMRIELFRKIAAWMPYNYLSSEVNVNMRGWSCLWETSQGAAKCLISGMIGLVVFLILGLRICKKQEVT